MGEIKELEEARAIFDFVYAGFHGGRQPHHSLFKNFMKNLKGDGWSIAIVKSPSIVELPAEAASQKNTHMAFGKESAIIDTEKGFDAVKWFYEHHFKQVIWQVGE